MTVREQLISAALLGTAQQLYDPMATGGPLDRLLPQLKDRLLESAALILAYERAGAMAQHAARAPAAAGDDPRPRCTLVASSYLTSVLADRLTLLPEWLSLAATAGQRPPEELVPRLLDAATSDARLREAVIEACGPLGVWLAAYKPEWSWVSASSADESAWETGTTEDRVAALSRLRRSDPARARELLQASWASESIDNKSRFLGALSVSRSPADEPFLETVLGDRSVVVRRASVEHLAALPDSKLVERMKQRLEGRLRLIRTGLLRKQALEVDPIVALDPAMLRDAIDKKPSSGAGLGERAWWTMQAIAAIPPSYWCDQFELTPADLVAAAKQGQWSELLIGAWRTAAIRNADLDWLEVLGAGDFEPDATAKALLLALPPAGRERVMMRLLKRDSPWLAVLAGYCPHDWSVTFTQHFIDIADHSAHFQAGMALRAVTQYASPDARWPEDSTLFADYSEVVGFRRRMRRAFTSPRT
jgi:hypothetical protein